MAVILNMAAGSTEGGAAEELRRVLGGHFAAHGIDATLTFVAGPAIGEAARHALERVRNHELDAIVAGGGDGSIRAVASVLSDSDVPMGIVPLGTYNHFARDLAIPTEMDAAVAVIAAGVTRRIDVGEVNGRVFINNSSIGLYPTLVVVRTERRNGTRLPKWIATLLAAPRLIRSLPVFRLTICAEDWTEPLRSPFVFVGNNEYSLSVPAFGQRATLDRGELWLYVAKAEGWPSLLWHAGRAVFTSGQDPAYRPVKVTSAEISSRRRHLLVACDGEVEVMRAPLRYAIRPRALRVFAPAPSG